MCTRRLLLTASLLALLLGACADSGPGPDPAAGRAAGPSRPVPRPGRAVYHPPVDAPVADPFRAPPGPFAAGNRGIEYATEPGMPAITIAAGRVVFAGPVGGSLHVTVLHPDGVRSSYSHLRSVAVTVGDRLRVGQAVGATTARLHLGVRAGGGYLDPSLLFTAGAVRLVPVG